MDIWIRQLTKALLVLSLGGGASVPRDVHAETKCGSLFSLIQKFIGQGPRDRGRFLAPVSTRTALERLRSGFYFDPSNYPITESTFESPPGSSEATLLISGKPWSPLFQLKESGDRPTMRSNYVQGDSNYLALISGGNHQGVHIGDIGGKPSIARLGDIVFKGEKLKPSTAFLRFLSDLGLAPPFHSLLRLPDHRIIGHITEFVEGPVAMYLPHGNPDKDLLIPSSLNLPPAARQMTREIHEALEEIGIDPYELQVIWRPPRVYVIDTGHYRFRWLGDEKITGPDGKELDTSEYHVPNPYGFTYPPRLAAVPLSWHVEVLKRVLRRLRQ